MPHLKFLVSSGELFGNERKDKVVCDADDIAGIAEAVSGKTGLPVTAFDIDYYDTEFGEYLRLGRRRQRF
jgi:hypothetical protein